MGIYLNPDNENFKRTLSRPIYVGVNYDESNKTHTCEIERFVK